MDKKELSCLDAYEIQNGIKRKYGVSYFCKKYGCTEQAFIGRVRQLYKKTPEKGKSAIASLRKNDIKNVKKPAKNGVKLETNTEGVGRDLPTNGESQGETVTVETATLEQLRAMDAKLSAKRLSLQSEQDGLRQRHYNLVTRTNGIRKQVKKLITKLQSLEQKLLTIIEQDNELIEKIRANSTKLSNMDTEIQAVRERIEELSRIVIYVYNNGEITVDDSDVVLDDSGSEKYYEDLTKNNRCGQLRMTDLRVLAKVLAIYQNLGADATPLILFDNGEIEGVFIALTRSV